MNKEPVITRAFLLLVTGHFLQGLGYASMLLLPVYLAHLGASRTEIGVIMAMGAVGSIIARPAIAWALDVAGRLRTVIFGTAVLFTSMACFYFVTRLSISVYVIRLIMGAGVGACWAGYFTFATDLVPASRRTEGLALFGLSGMAPLLVNAFAKQIGVPSSELHIFFTIVAGVTALSLIPLFMLSEPRRAASVERFRFSAVLTAMRVPSLHSIWVGMIALGATVAMFQAFATVTAEHRGVQGSANIWITYAVGAAFVRTVGGRLPDRVGPARLVPPAFLSYACAAILAAIGTSSTMFLLAGLLAGVGHGFGFPVLTSQVVTRTPEHLRGSAVSTLTALWEMASLLSTPIYGAIADAHGDATMFLIAAAFIAGSLLSWWPLERRSR